MAVETLWEISRLAMWFATAKTTRKLNAVGKVPIPLAFCLSRKITSSLLTLGYIWLSKFTAADSQIASTDSGGRVHSRVRVESEVFNQPRRFRMALQAHLVELERKHKSLENELHEALIHLSTDDLQIAELKRRKLMVKDQIERLKHTAEETLH